MADTNTESSLLRQAVDGDWDAVTKLLEKHGPEVRKRIRHDMPKRWSSVLDEDDVMQQTYEDVFHGIQDAFLTVEKLVPWIVRIARNNITDAVRSLEAAKRGGEFRRIEPESDESYCMLYDLVRSPESSPSQQVAHTELRSTLRDAIEQLPDIHKEVLIIHDLECCSWEETASRLNCLVGAAHMRRNRALKLLAEIMESQSHYF